MQVVDVSAPVPRYFRTVLQLLFPQDSGLGLTERATKGMGCESRMSTIHSSQTADEGLGTVETMASQRTAHHATHWSTLNPDDSDEEYARRPRWSWQQKREARAKREKTRELRKMKKLWKKARKRRRKGPAPSWIGKKGLKFERKS
jgi:hypothetical protein